MQDSNTERRFISTGALPPASQVASAVTETHTRVRSVNDGAVSDVYPALAAVSPNLFGIAVVGMDGSIHEAGDSHARFTLMSVAKPFVFALVCQAVGVDTVRQLVGVNATGLAFNSLEAVERDSRGRTNPMVNPGAIATVSLAPGQTVDERWMFVLNGLSDFAGHELVLDETTLESAAATNHRNRSLADLLQSVGGLVGEATEATDLYTRQSCVGVDAVDLAVMGATLADGGLNPVTGRRVVDADVARVTLAVMTIAGLYETSGDWLLDVGTPGKSGISGGIVTVSPGKCGLGTYAPPLDAAGNSVRGQRAAQLLTRGLGLDLLASQPAFADQDNAPRTNQ